MDCRDGLHWLTPLEQFERRELRSLSLVAALNRFPPRFESVNFHTRSEPTTSMQQQVRGHLKFLGALNATIDARQRVLVSLCLRYQSRLRQRLLQPVSAALKPLTVGLSHHVNLAKGGRAQPPADSIIVARDRAGCPAPGARAPEARVDCVGVLESPPRWRVSCRS